MCLSFWSFTILVKTLLFFMSISIKMFKENSTQVVLLLIQFPIIIVTVIHLAMKVPSDSIFILWRFRCPQFSYYQKLKRITTWRKLFPYRVVTFISYLLEVNFAIEYKIILEGRTFFESYLCVRGFVLEIIILMRHA